MVEKAALTRAAKSGLPKGKVVEDLPLSYANQASQQMIWTLSVHAWLWQGPAIIGPDERVSRWATRRKSPADGRSGRTDKEKGP